MKFISFPVLCIVLLLSACHRPGIASGIPRCIYKEISTNSRNPDWVTGSVKEYLFQNELVYSFDPDTKKIADGASTIKDANCNTLCNIGGFGGQAINQCNGENFFKTAVYKRTIWEKK